MEPTEAPEAQETREQVRPGLVMIKRRTRKEDGRYLIFYDFERQREQEEQP